jgi:exopolyphosphatase / guanosine-5'-triphosphate,3'-diphosphate pyrophosphatase
VLGDQATTDPTDAETAPAPIAAIDVGTNTTRLLVARAVGGRIEPLAGGSAMTAVGAGLRPGGRIRADALDLVELTVRQMAAEARRLGAGRIVVACTAPGRIAGNADELLARLEAAAGVPARVLSGAEEAGLSFRGLCTEAVPDPLMAIDLGGGSLELMGGDGGSLRWATSIPIGVRSLTERFAPADPPPVDLLEPMVTAVRELVDAVAISVSGRDAVAAGGSAEALSVLSGGDALDRGALLRAVERLAASPAADLAEETGLEPERVRLSLAGAAAMEAVRRSFDLATLRVSRAGLREGLVLAEAGA